MNNSDRQKIDDILSNYGSAWSDGVAGLEKDFDLVLSRSLFKDYIIDITSRSPAKMSAKLTISPKSWSFKMTDFSFPDYPALDDIQLKNLDEILMNEKTMWVITDLNSRVVSYDLSKGYSGVAFQKLIFYSSDEDVKRDVAIMALYNAPYGVVYYKPEGSNTFVLWVDLEKSELSGAHWIDLPMGSGRLINREMFAFIDRNLKKNGSFGVYGDVTMGLASLEENFELSISDSATHYRIAVTPFDGHGHFLRFQMDKLTGDIDEPMAGHMEPNPFP